MTNMILDSITDLVSDFLYYDRKNDENLPVGKIEEAVKTGNISIEDIVDRFEKELRANVD